MVAVNIVAMGASKVQYFHAGYSTKLNHLAAGEVWATNMLAAQLRCDRAFIMDDFDWWPDAMGETTLATLKALPVPIYSTRKPVAWDNVVAYPLEAVVADLGFPYFANTISYAVALAIHERRFDEIRLWGVDFNYPGSEKYEAGRACVEFWLGFAMARGIAVTVPSGSTLLDTVDRCNGKPLYGYAVASSGTIGHNDPADRPAADTSQPSNGEQLEDPAAGTTCRS